MPTVDYEVEYNNRARVPEISGDFSRAGENDCRPPFSR